MNNRFTLIVACIITYSAIPALNASENEMSARLKTDIEYLCNPDLAGRDVPSLNGDLTAIWLAEQFLSIGLQPAIGDTSYLQEVPLSVGYIDTMKTNLTVTTPGWTLNLDWGDGFFIFPKDLASMDTVLEIDFCGYGIHSQELGVEDFKEVTAGSAALVLSGSGEIRADKAGRFALTPFKAAEASRAGAGLLAVIFPSGEDYNWHPREITDKIATTQNRIVDLTNSSPSFPIVYLNGKRFEELVTQGIPIIKFLTENHDSSRALTEGGQIRLKLAFRNITEERGFNVIGNLAGETPEYVVLGAHYDHLGVVKEPSTGEPDYHAGADDNASGVAGMLELCRRMVGRNKPQRGLLAIGFTAEEDGLLGSKYVCSNPVIDKVSIIAMLNMDMIGRNGFARMRDARNPNAESDPDHASAFYSGASPRLRDILRGARDQSDLSVEIQPVRHLSFSDAGSFHAAHIPAIHIFSGFQADYSSVSDIPEKINYEKLCRMVLLADNILINLIQEPRKIEFDPSISVTGSGMKY